MTATDDIAHDPVAEEARRWIVRMTSGDMTPEELAMFKAWRLDQPAHNAAFEQQRAMWRALSDPSVIRQVPKHVFAQKKWAQKPWALTGLAAAATIVGLCLFPAATIALRADYTAGTVPQTITLSDGSMAVLDADTAIDVRYAGGERRIDILKGQAWFTVQHGDVRPFRVAALNGVTEDVGTAFAVSRQKASITVAVSEGEVRVQTKAQKPQPLIVRQQAIYDAAGHIVRAPDMAVDDVAPWRQGEILLQRTPVKEAVTRIGRYRRMPVILIGRVPNKPLSGVFRTDRPDDAIGAIAHMAGLTVNQLPGGILILQSEAK